ncbi:hypothetical protein [Moritella sp.]|uniref:hypothetical protein n=1 Tax=Moritella sp. TaxID=78556 RepID=UPI001DC43C6D|nr:hypothetical protein [Moritella sp.]MCJ8351502.1 hypothetical protein [Moritella sp.]NQZ40264.1 hypothetical protein [Moritella sp.]
MEDFPIELISATKAKMKGPSGDVSLEIELAPFELKIDDDYESVKTSIRLDGIKIPSAYSELEGREFLFPTNPENGYIDGSVYFFAAHSPVDVTKISFGKTESGKLSAIIQSEWILEFERTGYKNFSHIFEVTVEL